MALTFSGSGQLLSQPTAVVATYPMTLSAWIFMTGNPAGNSYVLSIADSNAANEYGLFITPSGQAGCNVVSSTTGNAINTVTTLGLSVWNHVCAVFSSPTSRTIYLNGGGAVVGSTSNAPGTVSSTIIGSKTSAGVSLFPGSIALPQIWNIDLTSDQVVNLFLGDTLPENAETANLASYAWLLGRKPEPDFVLTTGWTVVGSPVYASNPSGVAYDGPIVPDDLQDVPVVTLNAIDYVIGGDFETLDDAALPVVLPDFMTFGATTDAGIPSEMINEYNRVFEQMTYKCRF